MATGNWPANAISDIKKAIEILKDKGYIHNNFTLISGLQPERVLHYQIGNIPYTYYSWLTHHKIICGLIVKEEIPIDEVRVYATYSNFPFLEYYHSLMLIKPDSYVAITDIQGWENYQGFDTSAREEDA